ncbi:hypothetical protein DSO57_1022792 [Entomophthora muscae]|uniref:Uncharacterized protein n=1 Tax=Entomophthora muscae TaxID=34485 RepID=A0ACC2TE20_9FUNG|nr:hypothetical protein DSO57_1022792 [Entomophthora muscae]
MKQAFGVLVLGLVAGSQYKPLDEIEHPCGNPHFEAESYPEVEKLMSELNTREKIGQLVQINIWNLITDKENMTLDPAKVDYYVNQKMVGSFLNTLSDGSVPPATPKQFLKLTNDLQRAYQKTRAKIPMVYGLDSVHGANYVYGATLLPQQLAIAATFNRNISRIAGEITAKDTRAVGVHWNFSPILDIAVNKQWPRVYETFGEDPYLVTEMGREIILGYQGCSNDLKRGDKVAATMKHFIGYSATRSGKDVDGSWMSERIVNDIFRPSFQAAVEVGIATAMESYSDIDGDHIVNSKQYLVDLLRTKMGFKGALVTDWGQIEKLHANIHIAPTQEDAVRRVMKLGSLDMSMVPDNANFTTHVENLIKKGLLSPEVIDTNVRRILTFKHKLGLLATDGIQSEESSEFKSIGSNKDTMESIKAAQESVILLENKNQTLPLKKGSKLLVTGPTANSYSLLTGGWTFSWQGTDNEAMFQKRGTTILQGLKGYSGGVTYLPTVDINGKPLVASARSLVAQARGYDAVVLCLGENHYTEFLGNIDNMELPKGQLDLIQTFRELTDKPLILVLTQGRPRVIGNNVDNLDAILTSFLAGPHAGKAIADIIFGTVNPSGRLPITYANHNNDNAYNYYRRFNEFNPHPQWEFGHGLSYTSFKYADLTLSKASMFPWETIHVQVSVTNTGSLPGMETILMYITDQYRSISPEVKKLRGFEKVLLNPGQTKTINFNIFHKDLMYASLENRYVVEAGTFTVAIGDQSTDFELIVNGNDGFFDMGA